MLYPARGPKKEYYMPDFYLLNLGEFWKEADGDQLLLRPGEDTIWNYAHERDKIKRLSEGMTELLEKKLARYLNEH